MSEFLVSYLDAIDERLLDYLDPERELALETVHRLRELVTALLEGTVSARQLMEDWPDWLNLAAAFVAAYGSDELTDLDADALLGRIEENPDLTLSVPDRGYLRELELQLDMYPESRRS